MKKSILVSLILSCLLTMRAEPAFAGLNAAPEMMGVREVIIQYVHFTDNKASDTCGLTREQIANALAKALNGTGVPAIPVVDAKPPVLGIARIDLIPEISTHTDENLDCVSWISLQAENRTNTIISPITTLRAVTVIYWRQHTMAATSQSTHEQTVTDVIQKMATQFAQQYRLDQPPELPTDLQK